MSPPTPRADALRNRERVLATARQAVATGDLSLQHNDLAKRAGVGVGTAYRHFPTRQNLLEALAEPAFDALLTEARTAAADTDPWAGFTRLVRAFLRGQLRDPAFAEVLADGSPSPHRSELFALASIAVDRATAAGRLRPGITMDDLHRLSCGTAFAARIGPDPDDRVELYLDILITGLRNT